MAEVGLLSEDSRVELIEGEIIEMSPIGSTHGGTVNRSSKLLHRELDDIAIVSVQNPVHIDDFSEPQPDLALLKPRKDFYSNSHPTPEDVLVVIEVADASVYYDRNVKPPLYARAGIPEAWRLCENSVIRSSVGLEGGYSPWYSDYGAIDQFSPIP